MKVYEEGPAIESPRYDFISTAFLALARQMNRPEESQQHSHCRRESLFGRDLTLSVGRKDSFASSEGNWGVLELELEVFGRCWFAGILW